MPAFRPHPITAVMAAGGFNMLKRRLSLIFAAILLVASVGVRADSFPVIRGAVSGLELCPQSICGAAIFVGVYAGRVGINPFAVGTMAVAVTHEDLPDPGETAAITGGVWKIQLLRGAISGVAAGGLLFNNGDNTYNVVVNMVLTNGGIGSTTFTGVLSHNAFPPTIKGVITQ
jgi:hypothetical protein